MKSNNFSVNKIKRKLLITYRIFILNIMSFVKDVNLMLLYRFKD